MGTKKPERDHRAEWQARLGKCHALRDKMRRELGGKCSKRGCGVTDDLQFNHTRGRSWEPSRCNMVQRMRLYYMDFVSGRLSLLCRKHNIEDAKARAAKLLEAKRPESKATETHKAVRDLPKAYRPGVVRRRALARARKGLRVPRRHSGRA